MTRPVPVADERSTPYWAGASRHQLVMARCRRCSKYSMPPEHICARCHSTDPDYVYEAVSGAGAVRSWTVIRQSLLPGLADEVPFVLVDVELAEQAGLRLIGRLLDGPNVPLRMDAPVQVAFEDIREGVSVPAFTLDQRSREESGR